MFGTPLYRDAVWEQFSREEYARRYAALRTKMRAHKLDVVIVPGGPSHWSFGGGMTWLTGHWGWHAISSCPRPNPNGSDRTGKHTAATPAHTEILNPTLLLKKNIITHERAPFS